MQLLRDREVLQAIRRVYKLEQGAGVSDGDKAFKRGWRSALNELEKEIKCIIDGRRKA